MSGRFNSKQSEDDLKSASLERAYLFVGELAQSKKKIEQTLESFNVKIAGNPDLFWEERRLFSQADAEEMRALSRQKSVGSDKKIFVICFDFLAKEAVPSLTRMIDESSDDTHFFIATPHLLSLSFDFKSRLVQVQSENKGKRSASEIDPETFLSADTAMRLKEIYALLKSLDDEEDLSLARSFSLSFLNSLDEAIYKRIKTNKMISSKEALSFACEEINRARQYLSRGNSSVKRILEDVSITCPVLTS